MPDMLSVPTAPPAPPGPPDSASAPPGRETEGPPFKEVLKDHQARTATAEGRSGGDDTPKGPDSDDPATTGRDATPHDPCAAPVPPAAAQALALAATAVAQVAAATPAAQEAAAAAAPATPATPVKGAPAKATMIAPTATAPAASAPATATTTALADAAPADAAPGSAAANADRPATAPGSAAANADRPATAPGTAAAGRSLHAVAAPAAQAPPAQALAGQPVAAPTTTGQPAATAQPGAEASAQHAAATAAGNDAPAASATVPGAPQANPAATPAAAPAHRAAPAHAPALPAPLNTAHNVERIQAMVHVAHARGAAHARLELHPAELGGVTIQLHVTGNGLRAHIAADRAEALPLLQRAAADLQRSLESRGIDLQGLDFGLAPDAEAGASRDDGRARQRAGAFAFAGDRGEDKADGDDDLLTTPITATRTVELPAGALVDVRA